MRLIVRCLMGIAFVGAFVVIGLSIGWPPRWSPDTLNPVAAALAVLTAVISAWGAQSVVEREEDAKRPFPYLSFDTQSRYSLAQLVLRNAGGAPAFDVRIHWDRPLLNHKGEPIRFSNSADGVEAPILQPGESVSVLIDTTVGYFKQEHLVYSGIVSFASSPKGKVQRQAFNLSGEQYRHTLTFADELPKTLHELQRLPEVLSAIRGELNDLRWALRSQSDDILGGLRQVRDSHDASGPTPTSEECAAELAGSGQDQGPKE